MKHLPVSYRKTVTLHQHVNEIPYQTWGKTGNIQLKRARCCYKQKLVSEGVPCNVYFPYWVSKTTYWAVFDCTVLLLDHPSGGKAWGWTPNTRQLMQMLKQVIVPFRPLVVVDSFGESELQDKIIKNFVSSSSAWFVLTSISLSESGEMVTYHKYLLIPSLTLLRDF